MVAQDRTVGTEKRAGGLEGVVRGNPRDYNGPLCFVRWWGLSGTESTDSTCLETCALHQMIRRGRWDPSQSRFDEPFLLAELALGDTFVLSRRWAVELLIWRRRWLRRRVGLPVVRAVGGGPLLLITAIHCACKTSSWEWVQGHACRGRIGDGGLPSVVLYKLLRLPELTGAYRYA